MCAPSGPVPEQRLRRGVELLAERYRVRWDDPGLLARTGYLAGDDARRADELNRALRDPDVRAVLVARGGYGVMRILSRLDADALRRDPKLIVGFSDITALLGWALARAGVRGIHGPVVAQLGRLEAGDRAQLFERMESPTPAGRLAVALSPLGARGRGRIEGRLVGGNLCMLSHLVGTPYQVDWGRATVFVEDVGERPYAVDRYLTRLQLAGAMDGVPALLCGDFDRCEETVNSGHPDVWQVIDERLSAWGLAGLRGLPVGHGDRNLALPFGARCAVDLDRGQIELLEAAVA